MTEMTRVNSSNIHSIGYEGGSLHVRFANDTTYVYHGVTPELYAKMRQADSKMKFLNENIKGKFEHRKLVNG